MPASSASTIEPGVQRGCGIDAVSLIERIGISMRRYAVSSGSTPFGTNPYRATCVDKYAHLMNSSGASGGVAAGVATFLVLSGCGTADAPKSAAPNPSPAAQPASSGELELGCGSAYTDPIAEVMARGRGTARVAGVILVGVHRSRRWHEANGVGAIAKLPLIMREGPEATVSVRGIAGVDVAFLTPRQAEAGSAVSEGATRLELFGCQMAGPAGQKPAKYVFYGIYLAASRPGCAELEVKRGGTRASTTVRMRTRTCSTGS